MSKNDEKLVIIVKVYIHKLPTVNEKDKKMQIFIKISPGNVEMLVLGQFLIHF